MDKELSHAVAFLLLAGVLEFSGPASAELSLQAAADRL